MKKLILVFILLEFVNPLLSLDQNSINLISAKPPLHVENYIATINGSPANSSVKLLTGTKACSDKIATHDRGWTPAYDSKTQQPGISDTTWQGVNMLCKNAYPCEAIVYLGPQHDCSASERAIGHLSIDANGNLVAITWDSRYQIETLPYQIFLREKIPSNLKPY